jgi:hypothetical protein
VSVEENKALVRREQQELWNHTGELDAADELFAADQAEAAKHQAAHLRRGCWRTRAGSPSAARARAGAPHPTRTRDCRPRRS